MADVFPPRGLPGRSEEWGRQVENRIEAGEKSEQQLEQKVDNGLRATGGQLAVLARQVSELSSHKTWLSNGENFSVSIIASGTTYVNWYSGSRNIVFPPPDRGSRNALFSVSANVTSSSSGGSFVAVVTGVLYQGQYLYRSPGSYLSTSGGQSQPPGWAPSTSVIVPVQVPEGVSPEFTFELQGSMYGSGTYTVSASDIVGVLQYGDLIQ